MAALLSCAASLSFAAQAEPHISVSGRVTDPEGKPVADLRVQLIAPNGPGASREQATDKDGHFEFHTDLPGTYTSKVSAPGFVEVSKRIEVTAIGPVAADIQTSDYRDIDLVAGWSPENLQKKSWIAIEAAYGTAFSTGWNTTNNIN